MKDEPPPDFDPSRLIDDSEEMESPRERSYKQKEHQRAPDDAPAAIESLIPIIHSLPSPIRKLLFTGSCCAGVAVLYTLAAWDHGWIPGVESSLAKAEEVKTLKTDVKNLKTDVTDMYVLLLGASIRDLTLDNCHLNSKAIDDHIVSLRRTYILRNGSPYPEVTCGKTLLDEGTRG